jgi:nucleotide-binding universal stress UspA family protein
MRRLIIAAVDGSEEATQAARVAASLARRLDWQLLLAHVVDDPPVFPYGDRWLCETQRRHAIEAGGELLTAVAAEIGEPGARKRVALRGGPDGDVAACLDRVTREDDAELLVLGSRARGRLAHALAALVTVPVVIVPPAARIPRFGAAHTAEARREEELATREEALAKAA